MALTLALAGVLGILWLLWWLRGFGRSQRLLAKLPGPWRLPVLGHIHHLPYDAGEFYNKIRQLCSELQQHDLFKIEIGPTRCIIIFRRAEQVEKLLSSQVHIRKSAEYDPVLPWLGTGLLTSSGDKWRTRRRLLTPAFHFRILQDFLEVFNEQADIFVEQLKHKVDQPAFDIFPGVTHCALDIICETAMGKHAGTQTDGNSEYAQAVAKISELVTIRQKRPWLWPDVIYNNIPPGWEHARCLRILHGYTDDVIHERRALFDAEHGQSEAAEVSDEPPSLYGGKKKLAFLDLLLQTAKQSGLSHLDIREEVDTFMFEGHDTTAGGIGWALHLIGRHPEVQEKLQAEADAVFGGNMRSATSADLKELKYLECVIKEALRLFPSVPMFGRKLEEDLQLGPYLCPAGTSALVVTSELHRDPRYFPDPEKFDPDRFTLENSAGRHPYAYVPFSAGPRNCIGQKFALNEEKVILSSILRHFHVTSIHKTEDMCPKGELILRPGAGVWVQLAHRK